MKTFIIILLNILTKKLFWGLQRCKYMYMYISTNKLTDICTSTTCKLALIKAVKVSYSWAISYVLKCSSKCFIQVNHSNQGHPTKFFVKCLILKQNMLNNNNFSARFEYTSFTSKRKLLGIYHLLFVDIIIRFSFPVTLY